MTTKIINLTNGGFSMNFVKLLSILSLGAVCLVSAVQVRPETQSDPSKLLRLPVDVVRGEVLNHLTAKEAKALSESCRVGAAVCSDHLQKLKKARQPQLRKEFIEELDKLRRVKSIDERFGENKFWSSDFANNLPVFPAVVTDLVQRGMDLNFLDGKKWTCLDHVVSLWPAARHSEVKEILSELVSGNSERKFSGTKFAVQTVAQPIWDAGGRFSANC